MNLNFQPAKYFKRLDKDNDNLISINELVNYLKERYVKISNIDAESVILEFDSDMDGNLNYEEFSTLCLPATNQTLKELALLRGN